MIPENMTFQSFIQFLNQYATKKGDMLAQSNASMPNRMFRINGLDLSVDLKGTFQEFKMPMASLHVERVYSTASPTVDKAGYVKLALDYDNIGNQAQYKKLQANDSFYTGDVQFSRFFLSWDVQTDTSIDIVVMIDMDYKAGAAKTSIVGTVNVQNTSATALYQKPILPSSRQSIQAINTTSNYVIPAGQFGIVQCYAQVTVSSGASVTIGGITVLSLNSAPVGYSGVITRLALAGETVSVVSGGTGVVTFASIELYPI